MRKTSNTIGNTKVPCIRCDRKEYKLGKIGQYGPVCNTCSIYFRDLRPCDECGELSKQLSRVTRLNINTQVCPKCATKDFGTCHLCNKHRLLPNSINGKKICKRCFEIKNKKCPICQRIMPGGLTTKCNECYWKENLNRKLNFGVKSLTKLPIAHAFNEYGEWLSKQVGNNKAALMINKHYSFFSEIDSTWNELPSSEDLLNHFGTAGLRHFFKPIQWLNEVHQIHFEKNDKEINSESRRINVSLNFLPTNSKEREYLEKYYLFLKEKQAAGNTTIRSVRLALSPVTGFLSYYISCTHQNSYQEALEVFLSKKPGQYAAISGFVHFLRERFKIDIHLPSPKKKNSVRKKQILLEHELVKMVRNGFLLKKDLKKWISIGLAVFHKLPKSVGKSVSLKEISIVEDGISITWNRLVYWIPNFPNII